jgi:hypothetical protein
MYCILFSKAERKKIKVAPVDRYSISKVTQMEIPRERKRILKEKGKLKRRSRITLYPSSPSERKAEKKDEEGDESESLRKKKRKREKNKKERKNEMKKKENKKGVIEKEDEEEEEGEVEFDNNLNAYYDMDDDD